MLAPQIPFSRIKLSCNCKIKIMITRNEMKLTGWEVGIWEGCVSGAGGGINKDTVAWMCHFLGVRELRFSLESLQVLLFQSLSSKQKFVWAESSVCALFHLAWIKPNHFPFFLVVTFRKLVNSRLNLSFNLRQRFFLQNFSAQKFD